MSYHLMLRWSCKSSRKITSSPKCSRSWFPSCEGLFEARTCGEGQRNRKTRSSTKPPARTDWLFIVVGSFSWFLHRLWDGEESHKDPQPIQEDDFIGCTSISFKGKMPLAIYICRKTNQLHFSSSQFIHIRLCIGRRQMIPIMLTSSSNWSFDPNLIFPTTSSWKSISKLPILIIQWLWNNPSMLHPRGNNFGNSWSSNLLLWLDYFGQETNLKLESTSSKMKPNRRCLECIASSSHATFHVPLQSHSKRWKAFSLLNMLNRYCDYSFRRISKNNLLQ